MDFILDFIRPILKSIVKENDTTEDKNLFKYISNGLEIYDPYHGVIYKNGTSDIYPVELGYYRLDKFIKEDKEILAFVVKEKIDDWTFILPMDNTLKEFKTIEMKINPNISKHNIESVKSEFKEFMDFEGIDIHYV